MSRYTNIVERKMTSDVGSRPASENRYTRAAEASIVRNTPKTVEKEDMYSKYKGLNYDQVNTYLNDNNTPDSDKEFLKHYGVNVGYNSAEDYQKNISDIASQMQKNSAQTQNKKSGMQMFLENWIKADTGLRTGGYSSTDFGESPEFVALRKERDQLIQNKNKWEIDHAYDNYSNLEQSDDYRIYSRAVDPQNTVSRYFAGMPNEDIQSETTGTLAYAEDNEKSTYQYILFSQGVDAANDYLKQMTPLWDKRKQEAANQKVIDSMVTDTTVPGSTTSGKYVDANGGQTLLNNAASIPMGMVGGVIGGVASVFENATGNANPYSPWHSLSNYADTVRNTTAKYLEDNTTTKVAGYNVASSLYNAAYSAAQSLVGANTFGKAYTYLMGLSAFESEAKDLYEQGASSENILAGALLSGVAESLFEEFSIENLLTNSNPSGFKRIVKNVFKQAGAEASEEMATELSNSITDYLIRGGASDYEQRKRELMANGYSESEATKIAMKEIAKNIGYAGVEGALSGAGMSFGQQTIGFVKNKSTGKDARKYADREKVMDAAKAAGVDSEEVAMAERGDKLSDAELGAIINETRGKVAEGMKTYTSKDATEEDIRKQDDAISKYADIYGKEYQYAKKYNLSNDEKIKLDGVEEHDGTIYVRTQNGDRIRADEAPLTFRQAEIVSEAEGMSNEAVKQAFVSIANTNDTDVDTLSAAVGTIFFGARTQTMSWDEVQKQMVTDNAYMTEAQARAVYDAGYNLKAESISSRQAKVEQIFREFKGSAKPGTFKDNTDHDTLTDYQKMMVTLGEGLSKLGINVEMVQHGYGYNGKYVKSENTITIDVLATAGTKELMKNTVLPVMSHEVTHWMKDKSPQMYHEMSEFVLDYLTQSTGATREQIIDNQIAHYRATHKGKDISLDDAIDEIVARSCEDMLGNSKKLTEFLEKKDKSFIEKFRAAVKRAFDRVIALFKDVDGAMSYSPEAREFQKSVEYFEKLQAKWDAMFEDALKKNAAGVNKTSVDNYGKDSDAEIRDKMAEVHDMEIQNAERYGLVPDANGNLVFSDDAFYSSDHVKDLRAKFSSESGMTFAELLEEYKGAIQIWNELGGKLNSKFLDEWNNQNPTKKAFTIFKSQVGYKYNVELSTMCKKGIPLFEAIDTIVRKEALSQLATKTLGLDEKKVLYDVLKHHGFEIPCAICYVEQSRQREGRIIERFLNGFESKDKFKLGWNSTLEAIVSEMKKQGVDYTLESLDRSVCTDNYEFKPINMDKATQDAFYDALIKLCNDEIDRWNKDERKPTQAKKSHLKKATLAAFKEAVGSRPNENLRIFRTLIADPDAIFRIDEDLLYSSFTNLNLSKCHTELGKLFGSQSGVSGSKSKERAVAYTGDILKKNWSASKTREAGGVRNQSNSDGMMYTMLDQIQFFVDMSAKGYYLHAYTKVIAELKLLGLSNGKINASLIPAVHKFLNADGTVNEELTREYAGLGADKKTAIFDDVEGISSKEAFMIIGMPEYSKSVCGICIGYSDNHIAALLDDARVQMIIGFHDKTDNPDKRFEKARYAHNYNGENEAVNRKTGETVHVAFGTFLAEAEKKFKRSKKGDYSGSYTHTDGNTYSVDDIPVLATVLYKEFCDSKGYDYAYKKFADHPNYYKLLADFGLRDSEGHYAPHKKVTFNFPETVPYLDADGTVQYEDTKEYMKRELEKELKVRDEISYQLADTSKDGILAELKMGVNEFGCDLQKMAQYWADKEGSSTEEPDTMNADRDTDEKWNFNGEILKPNLEMLTDDDWKTIYKVVKKLGYGLTSVKETKEVYSRYVGISGFNPEQSAAIMQALGLAKTKSVGRNPEREKLAKKTFGTTTDFREAGYILSDGYMLDFSGKRDGGTGGVRYMDHREVAEVFADEERPSTYGDDTWALNKFVSEGNIRLMDGNGVTIGQIEPTDKQYTILKRFINRVLTEENYFYLDLSGDTGYTIESRTYDKKDGADRIIRDIKEYFKNGELPYKSNLMKFHDSDEMYSDRVLMGSMFSGAGTLEAGLVYQMLDKEFAVENNKKIAAVYMDNHGKEHMFVGDVQNFDSKSKRSVFYLHASPVCKNFSNASHKQGETKIDILTAKATVRVLKEQMPTVFTVENVKRYIGSEAYSIITNALDALGYTWDVGVYKAADYGNATKRERMIIRAVSKGLSLPQIPSKVSQMTTWGEATQDLWDTDLIPSYLVESQLIGISNTPGLKDLDLEHLDKPLMIYDTTKSKKVTYAWADELAPTLTTKCGDARIIMPDGEVYKPTPKFMGRLQGLPDNFKYPNATTNAFKVIGNGIPTQLTKAVMGGVLDSAYSQTHDGDTLYSERDIVTPEEMIEDAYNEGEIYGTELDEYMKYAKVRDIKIADRNRLGETIKNLNARKTEASAELDSLSEIATPSAEQRERITSIKAELKQILKDIKSAKDERREIESQIEKIKTVMTSLRADKKIQDAEEKARKAKEAERKAKMETLQERYDRHGVAMARERDKRIRTIRTSVKTLADWINVNGKENYVPEVLKTDVARFLMAFNYSTREALGETFEYIDDIGLVTMPGIGREEDITLTNSLSRLTETIKSIKKANDLSGNKEDIEEAYKGIILDLPRGYIETLEALVNLMQTRADSFGNRKVVEHMTLDELAVLSETLNTLKKSIKGINELHQNAAFKKASDLGKSEITFAKSLGRLKSRNNTVQKIFNMLGWENLLPHFFFKRLGKAGESLGKEFVDAQSKFARMSREILDFTDSLFTGEEAKRWRSETETFTDMSGEKFTMTIAQMMALYCHGQRETSKRHMFNGGIRIADITLNGKTITDTNSGHNITTAIYDEIVDKLTKYDDGKALRVAQAMQKFMSTVCASWGNEVSMIRFGKKDFTEEFYIPAEVDVSNVMNAEPSEGDSLFRLLNMSFAKPLNDKARNRIIIRDLFEVFATHTSDMAKYSAFALPTLDAYKFINYKETEKLGRAGAYSPDRVTSVRGAIEDAYGKAPTEYFFGLMRDINGSERSPRNTGLIRQMLRNYKIARVGGSLKVAALQVTAYPRAAMVLSPDSLARAFKYGSNFDEAIKYSGLSAWKDLGYFDINVARSLTDMITKAQTNTDKVREIGMKGAEKSDSVTWGVIWNACKIEALKRDERLAANSEAHLQKAGELMDEVIVSSQVMDSTLTRSALMRTKDSGMQELTAFMSEPTMTYNMVMGKVFDVITEYRQTGDLKESIRKNSGGLIKVATIHFIVSSFAAILEGAALFWRDHEDKDKDGKLIDEYFEKVFDSFKGNILLQVPILKEIISNIMGYSSKRMATQGFADTIDGLKRTFKWVSDMAENGKSKTNIVKAAYKLLTGVSEVGGVAISNATREVLDILNVVLEALGQDRINY